MTREMLQQGTPNDETSMHLKDMIQKGWPEHKRSVPHSIRQYYIVYSNIQDELLYQNGVIFKGDRVIVPQSLFWHIALAVIRLMSIFTVLNVLYLWLLYSLKNGGIGLIRGDLRDYKPAHNLSLNERIRNLLSKGKTVYHLAFGESPFPVVKGAQRALKMFVHEKAYEPVAGEFCYWFLLVLCHYTISLHM